MISNASGGSVTSTISTSATVDVLELSGVSWGRENKLILSLASSVFKDM